MIYLVEVTYKITERILFIPFKVYRRGSIIINANSDKQASEKMGEYASEIGNVYTWFITSKAEWIH